MKLKKISVLFTIVAFVMSIMAVTAFAASEGYEYDWANGKIIAKGLAGGKKGEKRISIAKAQAARAARIDAMRKIAEAVHGAQITSTSSMEDLELTNDEVKTQTAAFIKGMQEIGDPEYDTEDAVVAHITLVADMYGAGSLASIAFSHPNFKDMGTVPFPQPTTTTTTTTTTTVVASASTYTGLIIDCSGKNIKPIMSPVIMDTNKQKIYGHQNLNYDKVVAVGMASYIKSRNDAGAARAGSNPLVVKAKGLDAGANPIIDVADANNILIANQQTHFLDNCSVVFVR